MTLSPDDVDENVTASGLDLRAVDNNDEVWFAAVKRNKQKLKLEDLQGRQLLPDQNSMPLSDFLQLLVKRTLEMPNYTEAESYSRVVRAFATDNFKVSAGYPEDTALTAKNLDDHLRNFTNFMTANPNYHIEIENTTIHLDERIGRAVVFTSAKVSGLFGAHGKTRMSVNKVHLRRLRDGTWKGYEMTSLRGPGHMNF